MSDKFIPRVLRVEHIERDDRLSMMAGRRSSHYSDWTEAVVLTPFGEIHVKLPGFHCQRRSYPALIEVAMDQAWLNFCNV